MDKTFSIPADVARCCRRLHTAGHAAHPVGGAVRDLVLGRLPGDWDVATSALPSQVESLFAPTLRPTGLPHGTVTVDTGVREIEITTFRREGPYSDRRRPDWVEFVGELSIDLARRDFTMNAMALDNDGGLIDPFGGLGHLEQRVICTVGPSSIRFREDGLRLYRAIRFSAQLDFELGTAEQSSLTNHPEWGSLISPQRIRSEVEKGLCALNPSRLFLLFSSGLLNRFLDHPALPDLSCLATLPPSPASRWAGLCAALLKAGSIDDSECFLCRFCMDKHTFRGTLTALESLPF